MLAKAGRFRLASQNCSRRSLEVIANRLESAAQAFSKKRFGDWTTIATNHREVALGIAEQNPSGNQVRCDVAVQLGCLLGLMLQAFPIKTQSDESKRLSRYCRAHQQIGEDRHQKGIDTLLDRG